ncbi:putative delta-60 repeat protein [Tahibacter aquaticus]|uniref:Putative delta-60 repeat protein n=1 Tax=Tahibacter aquaticus TaxID=520092 RepID=A0A4R6Z2H4_9GAMM|nr:delta-60 repeat domain-containing protein [Tahibacter aquaticus]TDR45782.1 putative delta-60 repeat protein [Tahibacter aquaticus]
MPRPLAVALYVLSLAAGAASAGTIYSDQIADPRFAPLSSPANWRRVYSSGTVDEKGVAVARTPDGGFVALISVPGGALGSQIGLVRYGPDGALFNGSFGSSGKVIKDGSLVEVRAMTVDSLGRIVVVGTTPGPGGVKDFGVLRFNADGSDDLSFGGTGSVAIGMEPVVAASDDQPIAVVEQVLTGGATRLVIAGNSLTTISGNPLQRFSLIGLRNNGTIDPDFGSYVDPAFEGRTSGEFVASEAAYAGGLVKLPNNTLLVVGTSVFSGADTDFGACYFAAVGVPFSNSCGRFAIDEPGPGGSLYDGATAVVQTSADTFVLAGTASSKMAALRLKLVGSALQLDTTFVGSSIAGRPNRFVSPAADSYVNDVAVRSDGSLLLAGRINASGSMYGALTRLRRDGVLDTAGLLSPSGLAAFRAPTLSGGSSFATEFSKVLVDAGKPVLFGSSPDSTTGLTDYDGVLTRLQSDLIFASGLQ